MSRLFAYIIRFVGESYLRWERWLLAVFLVGFGISFAALAWSFHRANTILIPGAGGTYIEGSVGDLQPLNPWFTITNDVNRDIVSLVFPGLLKYNPVSRRIEEDLATMQISRDGRIYTLKLKEGLFWHDSTPADPHPVTAEDVAFTFESVQDPAFPNPLLRQNFQGVHVEKVSDRAVQFRLDDAYTFFPSNLTLGIVPKRAFEGIPVERFDQALDFGFSPVGCGPYKMKSIVQTELSTEVTLERFERPLPPRSRLDRLIFRIFPDYTTLLSDLRNLDGLRLVPRNDQGEPIMPQRFVAREYSLPQYVALFFNLDRKALQDQKLRLGLQLGTDKQAVVDTIHESVIIDTPLMEIDTSDWRYQFDPASAQGALFESQWYFPEKVRLQRLLERQEANSVGPLRIDPIVLLDTGAVLTVTGSVAGLGPNTKVNGLPLRRSPTSSGTWIIALPTVGGTGALKLGENLIRMTDTKGKILDSFYLWRTTNSREFTRAAEEQRLVELFLKSKGDALPADQRVTVKDFFMEQGFLRRRTTSDPIGVRINDFGQRLELTLVTSPSPPHYREIAELVAEQWRALGVAVSVVVPDTRSAFEDRLLRREYDILLFGQSLLDNLDSYPYWHSSGIQKLTGQRKDLRIDAYNLSQYASFDADALLETIRRSPGEKDRVTALSKLRDVLKRDVPAIIIYSPLYTFAHHQKIKGVELGHLSLHSDRFLSLDTWFVKEQRIFKPGKSWLSFIPWVFSAGEQEPLSPKPLEAPMEPAGGSGT